MVSLCCQIYDVDLFGHLIVDTIQGKTDK